MPVAAGPFEDAGAALAGADYATTLRLYRAMADQGNGNAQFGLGTMYEKGRGVAQDDVEAAKWYRLAANQGHAQTQFNLGVAYDNGRGVVQDEVLAHLWFNLSVAQGNQEAAKNRDIVARGMTPAQLGACLNSVNRSIQFCGYDFGASVRLCHPSKEGILLWCPPTM